MELLNILIASLIGLSAGVVGGLAGIGGSIIMLPALALIYGYSGPDKNEHHLYMAAAMLVNVIVAYFSSREHAKAKAVRRDLVKVILPVMAVTILLGVFASNQFEGRIAKTGLVIFLLCYCTANLVSAARRREEPKPDQQRGGNLLLGGIGAITGFMAGFLGIGGGIVMVPLLQIFARIPIRQAIASSTAIMWVTAIIGSAFKISTLAEHQQHWIDAVVLAAPMGLGAVFGARIGAILTHKLNLPFLKVAISMLLGAAAIRMALPSSHPAAKFDTPTPDVLPDRHDEPVLPVPEP